MFQMVSQFNIQQQNKYLSQKSVLSRWFLLMQFSTIHRLSQTFYAYLHILIDKW